MLQRKTFSPLFLLRKQEKYLFPIHLRFRHYIFLFFLLKFEVLEATACFFKSFATYHENIKFSNRKFYSNIKKIGSFNYNCVFSYAQQTLNKVVVLNIYINNDVYN